MKRFAILALGAAMLGLPATASFVFAQSAPATASTLTEVTFDVPDMTCGLLPGDGQGRDERGRRGAIGRGGL